MYENWDLELFISQLFNLINDKSLCTTTAEKDLGVIIDQNLKFHQIASQPYILGLISKCFEHFDIDTLPLLYKTLVRPILEYANVKWGPYYIIDQKLLEANLSLL